MQVYIYMSLEEIKDYRRGNNCTYVTCTGNTGIDCRKGQKM